MSLTLLSDVRLPNKYADFRLASFVDQNNTHILALYLNNIAQVDNLLVRVHSSCLTGDVLHSLRCDCGEQLEFAMQKIAKEGSGLIVYLFQEGRGIGLVDKLRAYQLQDDGLDTVEANIALGHEPDMRSYDAAIAVLNYFGIAHIRLLTNNPSKISALLQAGITVLPEPIVIPVDLENRKYLRTKREKFGHLLPEEGAGED